MSLTFIVMALTFIVTATPNFNSDVKTDGRTKNLIGYRCCRLIFRRTGTAEHTRGVMKIEKHQSK